ncbi:hypothetical protein ACM79U_05215 [Pseudomonas aeruginosa]
MASAQPASAFPCLLLGAWLAFDAHGGGQAVAPPARVEARVPTAATDDWGRQPDSLMSAVPPRTLEASVGARGSGSASSRLWIADTDFRLHDDIGFFIQRMLIRMEPTRPGAPLSLDDPTAPVPLPMRTAGPADSGQDGVGILLRNVDMYLRGNIGFHVPEVKGWLVPNRVGQPVDFDRPQDMHFQVMEGEVLLSTRQLANLFNEHILAYDGTMLKDFRMSSAAGRLEVEGRVRPLGVGPWLPLRLGGGVEVDAASGALVYRPDQLKVIGLPLYGAMSLVGLPMSALVSLDRPGASLVGSAMRLDYRKVFPLLGIDGHVQEAWLDDQGLHLRFSQAPGQPSPVFSPPAAAGPSFLWLQSGDLKIFEILITYAQVLLKTETPDQVLTFNLQDYRKVLATGTTQVNEDGTFFMQVPPYANPL